MLTSGDCEVGVGVLADDESSLAAVLQRWMRRERLRQHELAGSAGMSRQHLSLLVHGRIRRPEPAKLRALARALATDPDGVVDDAKRLAAQAELFAAADYEDHGADDELRELLVRRGVNPQTAGFYEWLVDAYPDMNPTQQQLVRAMLEVAGRPGGEHVVGLLIAEAQRQGDGTPLLT